MTEAETEEDDGVYCDPLQVRMLCLAHAVTTMGPNSGNIDGVVKAAKAYEAYIMGDGEAT